MSYRPIDSLHKEIRLIRLAPGHPNDKIRMTLEPAKLTGASSPKFEALSYVWGTEHCPTPALVNGQSFPITSNLDAALRHLRSPDTGRVLWVDAVCINQKDDKEKPLQVQLMRTIYSAASKVVVWLGPADKHSEFLIGYLQGRRAVSSNADVRQLLESVLSVCSRPWFSRIWVVQEFALAATPPQAYCGHSSTLLQQILEVVLCLSNAVRIRLGQLSVGQVVMAKGLSPAMFDLLRSVTGWLGGLSQESAKSLNLQISGVISKLAGLLNLQKDNSAAKGSRVQITSGGKKTSQTGSANLDALAAWELKEANAEPMVSWRRGGSEAHAASKAELMTASELDAWNPKWRDAGFNNRCKATYGFIIRPAYWLGPDTSFGPAKKPYVLIPSGSGKPQFPQKKQQGSPKTAKGHTFSAEKKTAGDQNSPMKDWKKAMAMSINRSLKSVSK